MVSKYTTILESINVINVIVINVIQYIINY